jgi:hypothetical protein
MLTGAPAAGSFQPIDLAASIVRLNASTVLMSGCETWRGVPERSVYRMSERFRLESEPL